MSLNSKPYDSTIQYPNYVGIKLQSFPSQNTEFTLFTTRYTLQIFLLETRKAEPVTMSEKASLSEGFL